MWLWNAPEVELNLSNFEALQLWKFFSANFARWSRGKSSKQLEYFFSRAKISWKNLAPECSGSGALHFWSTPTLKIFPVPFARRSRGKNKSPTFPIPACRLVEAEQTRFRYRLLASTFKLKSSFQLPILDYLASNFQLQFSIFV